MPRTVGTMVDTDMMTRGMQLLSGFFHLPSAGRWMEELRLTARSLEELASSTEGEFLSLGARLQQFSSCSREISEMSASITALMSGTEMTDAMEGLRRILKKIQEMDEGSRRGTEILRVILERIEAMQRPLSGFERIIRNLRVLCNFIKIESARLERSDTGFNTLSEDVGKLAEKIASRSADLQDQTTLLSSLVRGNLGKIVEFEQSRQGQALSIADGASRCLNSLTAKHELSLTTLQDVASNWGRITGNIGEVVTSLQFHDITRQRIEHVRESLVEMTDEGPLSRTAGCADLSRAERPVAPGKDARSGSGAIMTAVNGCALQRAQLDHARSEVVSAIERIIGSLRDIACHVGEMCDETRTLLKVADTEAPGASFISSLEEGFRTLTGSITEYGRINAELSATIDHAARTIGAMSAFISDIEKIGIEIRMIGLNACIRAAQVGEKGAALGVLADSIHQLSADTSGHIDLISEGLKMVTQSAQALAESVNGDSTGDGDGLNRLEQEAARMMKPLRRIDEETLSLLTRIDEKGNSLSGDITSAFTGIQVHRQFDRGIDDVVGRLDEFTARMKSTLPLREQGQPGTDLEGLAVRYTMNSERQVHQAITGGASGAATLGIAAPAVAVTAAGDPPGAGGDDLGDNVELF